MALRPLNREAFVTDLIGCRGVIANTGFTFISEALHLGRKILTKPLTQQTEQESNALALRRLGLATVVRRLSAGAIATWAEQPDPPPANYPDVLAAVADWIHQGRWQDVESYPPRSGPRYRHRRLKAPKPQPVSAESSAVRTRHAGTAAVRKSASSATPPPGRAWFRPPP